MAEEEQLALLEEQEGGAGVDDVFVSAAREPARVGREPPPGSRAAACDRFVEQAMEEMGGINICEPGDGRSQAG